MFNLGKLNHLTEQIEMAIHTLADALFAFAHNLRLNNPRLSGKDQEARGFSYYSDNYYSNYAPVPVLNETQNQTIQRTARSKGHFGP